MTDSGNPLERLGLRRELLDGVSPEAPVEARMGLLRDDAALEPDARLGVCFALSQAPEAALRAAAVRALQGMPAATLLALVGHDSPTALLDFLALGRSDSRELDARLVALRNTSDQAAIRIAERADADLCERIAYNRERLLMTPRILVALHQNPACTDRNIEKAASFLRMNRILPELPPQRPGATGATAAQVPPSSAAPALARPAASAMELFDLDDVEKVDDDLFHGFDFDITEDLSAFTWDMTEDRGDSLSDEEMSKIEKKIAAMSVGQRVRLAHLGNKQVRGLLLRDRNKQVAMAVVKSGRLTDGEVSALAANRNIEDDVLREVATNREWLRKYPVKVALVNNPKTPPAIGVRLVGLMQKKDLQDLSRNHNVSSVIRQTAIRLFKQKYRSDSEEKKH